jgi:hypothetical protein
MKKETILQNKIIVELCKRGCKVHRTNSGLFYTPYGEKIRIGFPGQSDLQGHRNIDGKCFYIEVKYEDGKIREEQKKFIKSMQDSRCLCSALLVL